MRHFLTQRACGDAHVKIRSHQGVDLIGMRTGDIHHDWGFDATSIIQNYALYTVGLGRDLHHAPVEEERGANPLRRVLDIPRGQLRVRDITPRGEIHGTFDFAARRLAEARIGHHLGWCKTRQIINRETRDDLLTGPVLVGAAF